MQAAVATVAAAHCGPGACAILVPTRAAARELRRALANRLPDLQTFLELVTREEFYERLHERTDGLPPRLAAHEREVLLRRAAKGVAPDIPPPFSLRPGLILEMLRFYDELRCREQSLDDFSRKVTSQLEYSAGIDRGAERLLRQTEFLSATYAQFERLSNDTGKVDEHGLRALLLTQDPKTMRGGQNPYCHVIVTVADRAADPLGLYASDFDLLTRLRGLRRLEIIATENLLAAGFHERIHDLLPGIEEVKGPSSDDRSSPPPTLVAPPPGDQDRHWFSCRDREEELADFVRDCKHRAASDTEAFPLSALQRSAIVYQRPLPYLYLAREVFADGGVCYQSADALPLSAEPFAAAIDLVLSFLSAEANRESTIALLSSPHFTFSLDAAAVAALDQRLRETKFSGGWDRLGSLSAPGSAAEALKAAQRAAAELSAVRTADSAAAQFQALLDFLSAFESLAPSDAWYTERHHRARAAVVGAIESLRDAHARHDDEPLLLDELAGSLRRWIEAQTFAPVTGTDGVRLLDAAAAPYADVDELRIVGLVATDWPEPPARSIFYPSAILSQLGWPADASHALASRARFRDLISLPHRRISASSFTLEDDAIVAVSPFVEELDDAGLPVERRSAQLPALVFAHERMAHGSTDAVVSSEPGTASQWLSLRSSRTQRDAEDQGGTPVGHAPKTYAVSHVERYLECPFKYYAAHVLRLPDERDDEPGLTPQERGHFIHEVFEEFFAEWQRSGRRTITIDNVADALEMFERVVDSKLPMLPEADRAVERTHLIGSAAASGLAERAFAFEIEQGGDVVERLLEHRIEGTFRFDSANGPRHISIRAKADRIDLMADGTLRVIDYKLGKAPKLSRALQLPVYGVCAEQALDGRRERSWKLDRAGYVAFKEKDPFVSLAGRSSLETALKEGQRRFVDAVDAIERGEFPVQPDEPFRCQWCGYAGVCRKDYVGDE